MNRLVSLARWLKSFASSVGKWWALMSGGLSIPFAFLALFDIPRRLLFATLAYVSLLVLTVVQAWRLTTSADVTLRVESDLIDAAQDPHWIRGEIENEGDRAAAGCRLKLLRVEGQNVVQARKIENGELQWQGGGCGAKTLDPEERLVFDIGTRKWANNSPLVLLAFFQGNQVGCALPSPGTYELTFGLYGADIPSQQKTVIVEMGPTVGDIRFS